jgi:hypothetical protein
MCPSPECPFSTRDIDTEALRLESLTVRTFVKTVTNNMYTLGSVGFKDDCKIHQPSRVSPPFCVIRRQRTQFHPFSFPNDQIPHQLPFASQDSNHSIEMSISVPGP